MAADIYSRPLHWQGKNVLNHSMKQGGISHKCLSPVIVNTVGQRSKLYFHYVFYPLHFPDYTQVYDKYYELWREYSVHIN